MNCNILSVRCRRLHRLLHLCYRYNQLITQQVPWKHFEDPLKYFDLYTTYLLCKIMLFINVRIIQFLLSHSMIVPRQGEMYPH